MHRPKDPLDLVDDLGIAFIYVISQVPNAHGDHVLRRAVAKALFAEVMHHVVEAKEIVVAIELAEPSDGGFSLVERLERFNDIITLHGIRHSLDKSDVERFDKVFAGAFLGGEGTDILPDARR